MVTNKHLMTASQDATFTQPFTQFMSFEDVAQVNGNCRWDTHPDSGFGCLSQQPQPSGGTPQQNFRAYAGSHVQAPDDELVAGDPALTLAVFRDPSATILRVNNNSEYSGGGSAGANQVKGITIGGFSAGPGNSPAEIKFREGLWYDEESSSEKRGLIMTALNSFYGTW